ncbi:4Fe-4S ferredoxin N-terminal domain-containing protein [Salinilacihabitans rarus]|uniref:4Fe-4S ferredoxin N-terminal domain-containing protein n=1 Tax=Salinilacihabitans rarus TaxID=2961596 RepID=UPI0020C8C3E1|nr:4Fe-4S ferredoxin N-terminal domain-containing protein [Salinilacihabitans rarus]
MTLDDQNPLERLEALDTEPEPGEYDQDLGRRIGRDAVRVWRGELSEAEFYRRYDEALRATFGDEYRPPEVIADE